MPVVSQLNSRIGGTMAAVVVVFWSLVVWCSGRKACGTLVARFVARWSLVAGPVAGNPVARDEGRMTACSRLGRSCPAEQKGDARCIRPSWARCRVPYPMLS